MDVIKIDKSFVDGIEGDEGDRLRAIGADLGQGFLFGKPMPAEELRRLIDAEHGWTELRAAS